MPFRPILVEIARGLKARSYLEYGINKGITFNQIAPLVNVAHAVDPNPRCLAHIQHNQNLVWHNCTSDTFLGSIHPPTTFDLVFIDGDHRHEQSLRDMIGIAPYVRDNGLICLHDTYPPSIRAASPEAPVPFRGPWCGDTYKTAWYIREQLRDDYEIVTLPFYCGLSIVRKASKQVPWL